MPDKAAALLEAHRVLRSAGVFLMSVWDAIETNDLERIASDAVARLFPADPPKFHEAPLSLCKKDALIEGLRDAGFRILTWKSYPRSGTALRRGRRRRGSYTAIHTVVANAPRVGTWIVDQARRGKELE